MLKSKDSIGELLPPNRIIYRDAFAGVKADLMFVYAKGFVQADVVLRENPPLPVGMDPASARLQVISEFLEPPAPIVTEHVLKREPDAQRRAQMAEPDIIDETVDFGAAKMIFGRAFVFGENPDATDVKTAPVAKRWIAGARTYLIESVEYNAIRPELENLPKVIRAELQNQKTAQLDWKLMPRRAVPAPEKAMEVALAMPKEKGLVIDWSSVISQDSFTFTNSQTYLIDGYVHIYSSTVFENAAVIKYSKPQPGYNKLMCSGSVTCPPTGAQAVFTARDDHSVGASISNSDGIYPPVSGYYGGPALDFYSVNNGLDIKNLQIRYAETAMSFFYPAGNSHTIHDCWFITNYTCISATSTYLTLSNLTRCAQTNWTSDLGGSTFTETGTRDRCDVPVNDPSLDSGGVDSRRQNESSLIVWQTNVVVAFNDRGSGITDTNKFTGYARSTNSGASFKDMATLPSNSGDEGDGGDPSLAVEQVSGTIYFVTAPFNSGETSTNRSKLPFFRSTNAGATFTLLANSAPGFGLYDRLDKPWIAVDNFSGPGQSNVYQVFLNQWSINHTNVNQNPNGVYFSRSINGGQNWDGGQASRSWFQLATTIDSSDTHVPFVAIGTNHEVYVFYYKKAYHSILEWKSTDRGTNWSDLPDPIPGLVSQAGFAGDNFLDIRESAGSTNVVRNICFPQAAVNPANGHIYLVYPDKGTNSSDQADIFFVKSTDAGQTWSARYRVNDDTTTNDQWHPSIAVKPNGTQLFIAFYDRRADPSNAVMHAFGVIGDISGSTITFKPNFQISASNFPVASFGSEGDYDTATADNSYFYYAWGDNRNILSTLNTSHEANVRFTKIQSP